MKKYSFLSLVLVLCVFACERELSGTSPQPREKICNDSIDNDGDGLVDCEDPDCASHTACNEKGPEIICNDGIDNDGDGFIDCADVDCASADVCVVPQENCTNGVDDDGDGLVDCDDPDCASHTVCNQVGPEEICDDGLDNDRDGKIDCDDADCAEAPNCLPRVEICDNGMDDDRDGFVDCDDVDCVAHPACQPQPVCGNGIREAGEVCDGADLGNQTCVKQGFAGGTLACNAACSGFITTGCYSNPVVEICDNGLDDDGDGFIDCDDADCWHHAECQVSYCGDGVCNGSETPTNCPADCGGGTGPVCGNSKLEAGEKCDGADLNGQTCVSRGFAGGTLQCNASCSGFITTGCYSNPVVEICNNGLDDDGDGLIDWLDPDCHTSATAEKQCDDGIDNDGDGYVDCADHDCAAADVCRASQISGDQYLVMYPGNGYLPGGCDGTDGTSWTTTCTGKTIMGNYKNSSNVWAVSYSQADPAVGTDLCSASVINTVNLSGFQFLCVSPTAGACSNATVYIGCSVNPDTGRQTQANLVIVMNKYDSSQISQRNAYFPNGRWREISISGVVWYSGLTPPQ